MRGNDIKGRISDEDIGVLAGRRGDKAQHAARMADIGRIDQTIELILRNLGLQTDNNAQAAAQFRAIEDRIEVAAGITPASLSADELDDNDLTSSDLADDDLTSADLDTDPPEVADFNALRADLVASREAVNDLRADLIATRAAINELRTDVRDVAVILNNLLEAFSA